MIVARIENTRLEEPTDFYDVTDLYELTALCSGSNEELIMMLYRKMRLWWCE